MERLVTIACSATPIVPVILDVYLNLHKTGGQHLVEVKFSTREGTLSFRREGVAKAEAKNPEFTELFLTNSVTQATHVRIEIMKILEAKASSVLVVIQACAALLPSARAGK